MRLGFARRRRSFNRCRPVWPAAALNNSRQAIRDLRSERTTPTPGAEHKRQISDDSAKLLTLAMALKAEVDKTNKDMLSLDVIRKADEIEKLAHNVRDKMKVSVGGS
jgi:hypothetical protein